MGIPGEGLAGRVPGIGTISGAVGIRAWVLELRAFGLSRLTRAYSAEARSLKVLMKETGFLKWADFWHYGRTQIPLTKRLFCEQVFSDMGGRWSSLITGFGPLGKGLRKEAAELTSAESRRRRTARQKSNAYYLKRKKRGG